jgi:hypothetical protein
LEIAASKLRETRGAVALRMAVILMVGTLLFSAALQIYHVYAVVDLVTGKADEAVLAAAADNGPEIFRGIREGAGVARRYENGRWVGSVSTSAVEETLLTSLGAVRDGSDLLVEDSYRVKNLETHFENAEGTNLSFTTTMTLEIPLSFGGDLLPPIHKTLEVKTSYAPRF